MRLKRASLLIGVVLTLGLPANAEDPNTKQPTILPGSAWSVLGNISPVERDNVISASYLEQGITVYRNKKLSLVPYVSVGLTADTKGYDWDNRLTSQAGVKLVRNFRNGIVSSGIVYAQEYRWKTHKRAFAPIASASYWFGWQSPSANRSKKKSFTGFPGSSWGIVGNISPVEKNNVISNIYVQQGVAIAKAGSVSIVPFGESNTSLDTKGYDWNNRQIYGAGIKFVVPGPSRVAEFGASYLKEHRWRSNMRADGIVFFVKLWFGWNPNTNRKGR